MASITGKVNDNPTNGQARDPVLVDQNLDETLKSTKPKARKKKSFGTAVSRVLESSHNNQNPILSRIDRTSKKRKIPSSLELPPDETQSKLEKRRKYEEKRLNREFREKEHVLPDIGKDGAYEKMLLKTATRGVVTLFNAVKKHQKQLETALDESGSSSVKQRQAEKRSKSNFLKMLKPSPVKGETSKTIATTSEASESLERTENTETEQSPKKSSWSVLNEEFMMGGNLKDWDQESDGDDE
eukprot:119170_1